MYDKQSEKSPLNGNPLVGRWFDGDEDASSVVLTVRAEGDSFAVEAVDGYDEEAGEVYDVQWDGESLPFAVHWTSTGRFGKYRLLALSEHRVDLAYTYTRQETWHRLDANGQKYE